jgi:hypothetical protein
LENWVLVAEVGRFKVGKDDVFEKAGNFRPPWSGFTEVRSKFTSKIGEIIRPP